jgi:hypothetical protein
MQDPNHKRKQNRHSAISWIALTRPLFYECFVGRMQLNCQDRDGAMKWASQQVVATDASKIDPYDGFDDV